MRLSLAGTVAALLLSPEVAFSAEFEDFPRDGVILGQGWNDYTNEKTSDRCVDFTRYEEKGQAVRQNYSQVLDKESLLNSLDVSASAKINGLVGSGSARVRFVQSFDFKREYLNISAHVVVENGVEYVGPSGSTAEAFQSAYGQPGVTHSEIAKLTKIAAEEGGVRLTQTAQKLASENPAEFLKKCGTGYVSSVFTGAELVGVLTYLVQSIDEKRSLSASASGRTCACSVTFQLRARTRSRPPGPLEYTASCMPVAPTSGMCRGARTLDGS